MSITNLRILAAANAARNGDIQQLKQLHKLGVDLTIPANFPLRYAISTKNLEVIKFLIDHCGVDATQPLNKPIHAVETFGSPEMQQLFKDRGLPVYPTRENEDDETENLLRR